MCNVQPKINIMRSVYNFLTVLFVVQVAWLSFQTLVAAQEDIRCRNHDLNLTDVQKSVYHDCLKEVAGDDTGFKWEVPKDKVPCFGACIMERKSFLTSEGLVDHQKILNYIRDVMKPEEIKMTLVDGVDQCIKDHGWKIKKDDDPKCTTFMETGNCIHDVFVSNCL